MAANLSPDYLEAEREYKAAATPAEKIAALERMLSTVPKHKGTEKLQADIKRKLSQARREGQKKGGAAHTTPFWVVEKEGAGQVLLLGPPNSGKSLLLATLTHARPEVADYPFTTRVPTPGMMLYQNVRIQLVDLPPITAEYMEPWIPQVIRTATASVLLVDVNDPAVLDGIEFILGLIERSRALPPKLLVGNKIDLPGGEDNFAALEDLYRDRFPCLPLSITTCRNLDAFARAVFDILAIVRVYTKAPGKAPDLSSPFVLKRGGTVEDAARLVHRDFAENLKYARLFRAGGDRDGMMVERAHVVQDEDILEFHI